MKFQKWIFLASIVLFLGAIAVVAFTIQSPSVLAQGPGWFGSGSMRDDNFGPEFGMGPGGERGQLLVAVAAKQLGLTSQDLLTQLQAGKTIADLAKTKNVTVDTIVEAVLAPQSGWLKGMVDNGQLTQAQADAQLALLKVNVSQQISQPWSQGGHWGGPENSLLTVAADKLGLTSQDLLTQLQAGKTIADLAKTKSVTVDTIVSAVLAPRSEQLKQLVTGGQLTQDQADAQLALLKANVTRRINEAWPQAQSFGPGMGQGRMGGHRGGEGMMGNGGWW